MNFIFTKIIIQIMNPSNSSIHVACMEVPLMTLKYIDIDTEVIDLSTSDVDETEVGVIDLSADMEVEVIDLSADEYMPPARELRTAMPPQRPRHRGGPMRFNTKKKREAERAHAVPAVSSKKKRRVVAPFTKPDEISVAFERSCKGCGKVHVDHMTQFKATFASKFWKCAECIRG